MADDNLASPFIQGALSGQEYQMNKLRLLEAPVKLEQEKLALKISQQSYDRRQKMADFLTQHSATIPDGQNPLVNAANSLIDIGTAEAQAGMVEEATKSFSHASTIITQQEDSAYKNFQMTIQKTKFADSLLIGVHDQASLDQVNAYVRQTTGSPSALEGHKYSPELIDALRKSSESKRTAAQEALTKAQTEKAKVDTEAARELGPLRKTQESLNATREENLRKAGGEGLIAKPKNIAAVTDAIVKDSGDSMSPGDARVFARDIALDVEKRMSRHHQTQAQAVASALDFAKKHGALAGIAPAHSRPGQSPKKPLPLPEAKADPTKYRDQMWYEAPDGPRRYDAETQKLYKAGEGPPGSEDDEDEE